MSITAKKTPVTVYFDGFNLYHAIAATGDARLKWISYRALSESFLRGPEYLHEVNVFTSLTVWDGQKRKRHQTFLAAQRALKVKIFEARFKPNRRHCMKQNRRCKFWEEKENDVAISVKMLGDAHAGVTKRIILVTADTDQIPAIKYLKDTFPDIELSLFIPPARKDQARDLGALFSQPVELRAGRLLACLLPESLSASDGTIIIRPAEYAAATPALTAARPSLWTRLRLLPGHILHRFGLG